MQVGPFGPFPTYRRHAQARDTSIRNKGSDPSNPGNAKAAFTPVFVTPETALDRDCTGPVCFATPGWGQVQ